MKDASVPVLVFSQGDPAGIGPEILLKLIAHESERASLTPWKGVFVMEAAAIEAVRGSLGPARETLWLESAVELAAVPSRRDVLESPARFFLVEPQGFSRQSTSPLVSLGQPMPEDARAAIAALDTAVDLVAAGVGDALVTAPLSKKSIADTVLPEFRGHTDYLAEKAGCTAYGRDYLMAFLSPSLKVALLSTHIPLRAALDAVTTKRVLETLELMARHVTGTIALAGLNPHAGEGGLLGKEDQEILVPAVAAAKAKGIKVIGPESPDTVFHRATKRLGQPGEFDWVLALYHDQGLIAVKSLAFGEATNWTLGLPYLRTSVDHGTAYDIAGLGKADVGSLLAVVDQTLELVARNGVSTSSSVRSGR